MATWTHIFVGERGIAENLTWIFLLLSSVVLITGVIRRKQYTLESIPLLFALMYFVAAGEEASWGQHWLKFSTPEILMDINSQKELNLHNIYSLLGFICMSITVSCTF
ncbi:hypothetical protein FF011L_48910 [Roseimaritima multifibrata]|uniref:Uncharacterized protein n=1 Tax=Roseimaritima multifibrata TaxID=1930274 RepID=A0A517MMS8_9BACT|nr:hypothetical protein FF011L_48910 [Roseimaritima multifibrata]